MKKKRLQADGPKQRGVSINTPLAQPTVHMWSYRRPAIEIPSPILPIQLTKRGQQKAYALPLPSDNERSFGGHIGDFNTPPALPRRILECFGSRISVLPHAELCMVPVPVHGPVLPELRFRGRTAAPEQESTHQHQQKPSFHFAHPSFLSLRERETTRCLSLPLLT